MNTLCRVLVGVQNCGLISFLLQVGLVTTDTLHLLLSVVLGGIVHVLLQMLRWMVSLHFLVEMSMFSVTL